jgi:hypothetical protein
MLLFEMSPPVVLSSKTSKLAPNSCKAADVVAKVTIVSMAFLVAEKVFRERKRNALGSARRHGAFEWLKVVFLVATA